MVGRLGEVYAYFGAESEEVRSYSKKCALMSPHVHVPYRQYVPAVNQAVSSHTGPSNNHNVLAFLRLSVIGMFPVH